MIYFTLFFEDPSNITTKLEPVFELFFMEEGSEEAWKVRWVMRDWVCCDCEHGGLGVQSLCMLNMILLKIWRWCFKTDLRLVSTQLVNVRCLVFVYIGVQIGKRMFNFIPYKKDKLYDTLQNCYSPLFL